MKLSFDYGLAPLRVRRDFALLGLIHRTVLGGGVRHFDEFFYHSGAAPPAGNWEKHNHQLRDYGDDESSNVVSYFVGSSRAEVSAVTGTGLPRSSRCQGCPRFPPD